MSARAALLDDGTCIAASRADRWLVTAPPAEKSPEGRRPCQGVATPLQPLPDDFDVERVVRYGKHVVYFGPAHPASAKDFSPLLVTDGPAGEPAKLESPIGWPEQVGQVSQGIIVRSSDGKLARWDGKWTELKPGGAVTSMAAEPDVIAVVIDRKVVRISKDGGNGWSDVTTKSKAATKSEAVINVAFSGDGELTAGNGSFRARPVEPPVHASPPVTTADFDVRPPDGVLALNGLSLGDDHLLRERIAKQCELSGMHPELAVSETHAAVVCKGAVYFTADLGQTFTELARLPSGVAGAKPALSGNRVLEVPWCVEGHEDGCAGRSIELHTNTGSSWSHESFEAPPMGERVFALTGRSGFFALSEAATPGKAGTINLLHIDDRGRASTHEIVLNYSCRSGRPVESPRLWNADIDGSGELRLVAGAPADRLDSCLAYGRVASDGHMGIPMLIDGRPQDLGTFGDRVVAIERTNGGPVLRVSDNAGKSWTRFSNDVAGHHRTSLGWPKCSAIGCDFDGDDDELLWRWGTEPPTATLGAVVDAK